MERRLTASEMISQGFPGAPFLEELRAGDGIEAVERYVKEKQKRVDQAFKHIRARQLEGRGAAVYFTGPMRASKTAVSEATVQLVVISDLAPGSRHVSTLADKRSIGEITSASGCYPTRCEVVEKVDIRGLCLDPRATHLEEVNFWHPELLYFIVRERTERGFVTIFSGLNKDYTQTAWPSAVALFRLYGELGDQLAVAELHSICATCHGETSLTQLEIPDGQGYYKLAPSDLFAGSIVPEVGDLRFTAQCRKHHGVGTPVGMSDV